MSPSSIIVTGASGALGRALAVHHAERGVSFNLWGRDTNRLEETASAVRTAGAKAQETCHDLGNAQAAIELLLEQDAAAQYDLAYLVAGVGDTRAEGDIAEDPKQVLRAAQINFAAPAAMASALASRMAERGEGRIVLIGSAAGHHSLPFAASYAGSKAGLARFSDALRLAVKPYGVSVTLAAPGFIDTPAAKDGLGNRPVELPVDEAARRIVRAAEQRKRHYVTPWPFAVLRVVDGFLPAAIRDRILAGLKP